MVSERGKKAAHVLTSYTNRFFVKSKRAQITIFVIIAILIVGALILYFAFSDNGRNAIQGFTDTGDFDVQEYLSNCMENEEIDNNIKNILIQGGNTNPELHYLFEGNKISYLCYTNEYYQTCINQEPLLIGHVEKEILNSVTPQIDSCIDSLKNELESRNYDTTYGRLNASVEMLPEVILINIDFPITLTKGENTRRFGGFQIRKPSESYQLVTLSTSIINFEARYGESDPATYMVLYPQTKVEKLKQGDGTTIYKVSDRESGESFNFAVRSLVFPPGYNLDG